MPRAKRIVLKKKSLLDSFLIKWPDKLKVILINIMRYYIKGEKLADNTFKVQDHIIIIIEL